MKAARKMQRAHAHDVLRSCSIVLGLLLFGFRAVAADDRSTMSLLGGRLSAKVPAGTVERIVSHDAMEAPPSKDVKARYFVELGGKRLMFMPTELFQRISVPLRDHADDFARATRERTSNVPFAKTWIEAGAGLEVLQLLPEHLARAGGVYLISDAIVRMPDGTVIEVPFFVDETDSALDPAMMAAVGDILRSLAPGPRALPTGAGTKIAACGVTVDLPADATAYADEGPDFTVCRIRLLVKPGQAADHLTIYSGHHPQGPSAPADAKSVDGRALGREVTWRLWETERSFWAEARMDNFRGAGHVVHLVARAADASARDKLLGISATTATTE